MPAKVPPALAWKFLLKSSPSTASRCATGLETCDHRHTTGLGIAVTLLGKGGEHRGHPLLTWPCCTVMARPQIWCAMCNEFPSVQQSKNKRRGSKAWSHPRSRARQMIPHGLRTYSAAGAGGAWFYHSSINKVVDVFPPRHSARPFHHIRFPP
jgi:hypothetical protein